MTGALYDQGLARGSSWVVAQATDGLVRATPHRPPAPHTAQAPRCISRWSRKELLDRLGSLDPIHNLASTKGQAVGPRAVAADANVGTHCAFVTGHTRDFPSSSGQSVQT